MKTIRTLEVGTFLLLPHAETSDDCCTSLRATQRDMMHPKRTQDHGEHDSARDGNIDTGEENEMSRGTW